MTLLFASIILVLFIVLVVFACVLIRLSEFMRIQKAFEKAWFDQSICTSENCNILLYENLGLIDSVNVTRTTFQPRTAKILLDLVARVSIAASFELGTNTKNQESDILQPTDKHYTIVSDGIIQPTSGAIFGVCWSNSNTRTLIFSFRATQTSNEIQEDLNSWQIDIDTGDVIDKNTDDTDSKPLVHYGFYSVMNSYKNHILKLIYEHKPKHVYFTGHSLGAAVATLYAYEVSKYRSYNSTYDFSFIDDINFYNFGSPRVGNSVFKDKLLQFELCKAQFRVVNSYDLITELPTTVAPNFKYPTNKPFNYEHAGLEHKYHQNWKSFRSNHFLPNYIHYLQQIDPA